MFAMRLLALQNYNNIKLSFIQIQCTQHWVINELVEYLTNWIIPTTLTQSLVYQRHLN